MSRQVAIVLYVVAMIAVIVGVERAGLGNLNRAISGVSA
jgi:hypothetical protein